MGIGVTGLLALAACGLKAPPRPREVVVPAPVEVVAVRTVPEGLKITFTLPSESLDGSPLESIGGYRVVREGPDGREVRQEVRFSVSEMSRMIGKSLETIDDPPGSAGTYRYCIVPFDMYGSRPPKRRVAQFCWEGIF